MELVILAYFLLSFVRTQTNVKIFDLAVVAAHKRDAQRFGKTGEHGSESIFANLRQRNRAALFEHQAVAFLHDFDLCHVLRIDANIFIAFARGHV